MRAIFSYVSGVFQNLEVDFWPLLKAEKVFSPSRSIVTALFIDILQIQAICLKCSRNTFRELHWNLISNESGGEFIWEF